MFENYGEFTIYETSSFRPPGGQKDNKQAFQCLKQKVNICFTSRRDRMKTGKYISTILSLPGCLDCVAQIKQPLKWLPIIKKSLRD